MKIDYEKCWNKLKDKLIEIGSDPCNLHGDIITGAILKAMKNLEIKNKKER